MLFAEISINFFTFFSETRVWLEYYGLDIYPERAFCIFTAKRENSSILQEGALADVSWFSVTPTFLAGI